MLSNTTDTVGEVECSYIGSEGDQPIINEYCHRPTLASYLKLIKDGSATGVIHPGLIHVCEVVVTGYLYPPGKFVLCGF